MNTITLTGRLTADADVEVYEKSDGSPGTVAKFHLAVDRGGRDGTDFIPVTTFDRLAINVGDHIGKGHLVAVTGRLQQSRWRDQDGQPRERFEVIAREVDFLARPKSD